MIKEDKIVDETYLPFVNKCLLKRKADFFDPFRKVNLDIGLKETKDSEDSFSNEKDFGVCKSLV